MPKAYFSAGAVTLIVEKLKDGRFDACTYKEGRLLTQQKKMSSEIEQFAHELLRLAGVD